MAGDGPTAPCRSVLIRHQRHERTCDLGAGPEAASEAGSAEGAEQDSGQTHPAQATHGRVPWVLSAKTPAALRAQAARLRDHLIAHPDTSPTDLAYSLSTTRTLFDHRAVVLAEHAGQYLDTLNGSRSGPAHPTRATGHAANAGKTAFLFTGRQPTRRDGT